MFRFTTNDGKFVECSVGMSRGNIIDANIMTEQFNGIHVFRVPLDVLESVSTCVIVLGTNCNIKCSYCFQREYIERNPGYNISFTPDQVEEFVIKFKNNLLNSLDNSKSMPIKEIVFWGGEPLVYWKTIQKLVPRLKQEIPTLEYFSMSSNGLLLDQEKLEFMHTWNIQLQLSDDGYTNSFRDIKIESNIDKIRTLINKFCKTHPDFRLHIHATFNKNNCNVERMTDSLMRIYGNTAKRIAVIPPYTPTSSIQGTLKEEFNEDQLKTVFSSTLSSYRKHYTWFKEHDNCNRVGRALDYIHGIGGDIIMENGVCASSVGSIITADSKCNLYTCRDAPFKEYRIGSFKDKYDFNPYQYGRNLARAFASTGSPLSNNYECRECEFRAFCGGICALMNNQKKRILCPMHFLHSLAIVIVTLEKEYKTQICNIQQDVENPLIEMIKDLL